MTLRYNKKKIYQNLILFKINIAFFLYNIYFDHTFNEILSHSSFFKIVAIKF